nr:MAG TPA: hypothetical protein [Caudoviricetes sp.]
MQPRRDRRQRRMREFHEIPVKVPKKMNPGTDRS